VKTKFWLPLLALAVAGCTLGHSSGPAAVPSANRTLVQFSRAEGLAGWHVENDDVMGGRSQSRLAVDDAGNAVFAGTISLENDGGFASIQCDVPELDVAAYRTIHLGLKGDGKRYQLRLDAARRDRHSYAADFRTSGDWQEIVLPFADFFAIRHGDRLDLPNYPGQTLARVQLLAGDGRAEPFRLEIDRIWLEK
jgi:hypothetical protein